MPIYKNNSKTTYTVQGILFGPGETKFVPKHVNSKHFLLCDSLPVEPPKVADNRRGRRKKEEIMVINKEEELNGEHNNQ